MCQALFCFPVWQFDYCASKLNVKFVSDGWKKSESVTNNSK
jgi:hypothetical protein